MKTLNLLIYLKTREVRGYTFGQPFMLRKRKGKKREEEKRKRAKRAVWLFKFRQAFQVKFEDQKYFRGYNFHSKSMY